MSDTQKSIRKLSRNFVIPVGSQVVLQTARPVDNGEFRKPGTVGFVVQSPPNNNESYTIQFSNGQTTTATFDEIGLRRREIDLLLSEHDFDHEPFVIYRCRVGSRAFGLANDQSDDDVRGIFLPPAEWHWSLFSLPEQVETMNDQVDEVIWELEKFVRLALKANPNILETLWTKDVLHSTPISERLREIRSAFLSKHVYKTYSGYVISQFRRMKNKHDQTGEYKKKHAMHLIRLLYSGINAVTHSEILVDVTDYRTELLDIRNGDWTFDAIKSRAHELDRQFQVAYEKSTLPEQPDVKTINDFLIEARRSVV